MGKKGKQEKGELTWDDIEVEIRKIGDLFKRIPEDLRADAAYRIAVEVAICGSYNHLEAIGILEEAKLGYRQTSLDIMEEEGMEGE